MLNPLSFISKFIKSSNQKELDRLKKIVEQVNAHEDFIVKLKDKNILAPFSGVLGYRGLTEDVLGSDNSIIITLDDSSIIYADLKIPEAFASVLRAFSHVAFRQKLRLHLYLDLFHFVGRSNRQGLHTHQPKSDSIRQRFHEHRQAQPAMLRRGAGDSAARWLPADGDACRLSRRLGQRQTLRTGRVRFCRQTVCLQFERSAASGPADAIARHTAQDG